MNLHDDHWCKVCDTACLWCDNAACEGAHCFNGHEHRGFEGRGKSFEEQRRESDAHR